MCLSVWFKWPQPRARKVEKKTANIYTTCLTTETPTVCRLSTTIKSRPPFTEPTVSHSLTFCRCLSSFLSLFLFLFLYAHAARYCSQWLLLLSLLLLLMSTAVSGGGDCPLNWCCSRGSKNGRQKEKERESNRVTDENGEHKIREQRRFFCSSCCCCCNSIRAPQMANVTACFHFSPLQLSLFLHLTSVRHHHYHHRGLCC